MPVVVDTDVVSFLFKGDTRAQEYAPHLAGQVPIISIMTLAELDRWALEGKWGQTRQNQMRQHLHRFLIYPYNRALCATWARVTAQRSAMGRAIECGDAWIAATAVLHNIPLVTHNAKHYSHITGLQVTTEP